MRRGEKTAGNNIKIQSYIHSSLRSLFNTMKWTNLGGRCIIFFFMELNINEENRMSYLAIWW